MTFEQISQDWRVPGIRVEVSGTGAVDASTPRVTLIAGQKTASGTATANTVYRVTSSAQAGTLFGKGSILHGMVAAYLSADPQARLSCICEADAGGGAAAAGSIAFTGPATGPGTLSVWIAGYEVSVPVAAGDSAADVGAALIAAVTLRTDLPVTAAGAATVTLTAKNKGTLGNQIAIAVNPYDWQPDPAGLTYVVTQPSGGGTDPTLTTLLAALGDDPYWAIIHPWSDATSMTAIAAVMSTRWASTHHARWGVTWTCRRASHATLLAAGVLRNHEHEVYIGVEDTQSPPWEIAAEAAGAALRSLRELPTRPMQTLRLVRSRGPLPSSTTGRWSEAERNAAYYSGVSCLVADTAGALTWDRAITTYQRGGDGSESAAWLDVTTPYTVIAYTDGVYQRLRATYPRHTIADDGTDVAPGVPVATPAAVRATVESLYDEQIATGLVYDAAGHAADLVCQRNALDRTRMDIQTRPRLVSPMIQIAQAIRFSL